MGIFLKGNDPPKWARFPLAWPEFIAPIRVGKL